MKLLTIPILLVFALFCCMSDGVNATAITFNYNNILPGQSYSPAGFPPWMTATFDDNGASGPVKLIIVATNLTGSEFISKVYFNLNPSLNVQDLSINPISGQSVSQISLGTDKFKADGTGGKFDILFDYPTSGGLSNRFINGDTSEFSFEISGSQGLTANDFNYLSTAGFLSAAHIQSIGTNNESSWIYAGNSIPEPTSILLVITGILSLIGIRRKL